MMKKNILLCLNLCLLFAIIDFVPPKPSTTSGPFRLPTPITTSLTLFMPGVTDGLLPTNYSCNSSMNAASPPLSWNISSILLNLTQEFMVTMSTVDISNNLDFNWGKYKIPKNVSNLLPNSTVGVYAGVGKSVTRPLFAYQPPCSSGPGWFSYTFSIYALSAVLPYNSSAVAKDLVLYVTSKNLVLSTVSITLQTCHYFCGIASPNTILTLSLPGMKNSILPSNYTCNSSDYAPSPPLLWNVSSLLGNLTQEFMISMSTLTASGIYLNWGKYKIPKLLRSLDANSSFGAYAGIGTSLVNPLYLYQPPCLTPGWFNYTISLYALSQQLQYNSSALAEDLFFYVMTNNLVLTTADITVQTCHYQC